MNYVKIGKHSIVRYDNEPQVKEPTLAQLENRKNLANTKINGTLSKKARQRLVNTLANVLNAVETGNSTIKDTYKGKAILPTFVTLTLSSQQAHTDEEIKRRMLNRFLVTLARDGYLSSFVWKAEKQKNGNIHFHIVVTNYIPHVYIKDTWNNIQNDYGYIDNYRRTQMEYHKDGFKVNKKALPNWTEAKQREAYNYGCATNWSHPNSTDIHSLRRVKNTIAYIAKYMAKNQADSQAKVDGKIWGRSDNVGLCEPCKIEVNEYIAQEITLLADFDWIEVKQTDYCTLYIFKDCSILDFTEMELYTHYESTASNNFFTIFNTTFRTDSIIT